MGRELRPKNCLSTPYPSFPYACPSIISENRPPSEFAWLTDAVRWATKRHLRSMQLHVLEVLTMCNRLCIAIARTL
jgi:hypothetical protein